MNEQLTPLFRVQYRLQRADHLARVVALSRRSPARTLAVAASYLGLLLLLLLWQVGAPGAVPALSMPGLLETLPWLLPVLLLLLPPSFYAAVFGGLAYRRSGLAGAEITIDVTAGGIVADITDRASRLAWSAVSRLIETPDYLFLQLSRREALIIPRRAIGDPADYQNLVGFIRARTGLSTRR